MQNSCFKLEVRRRVEGTRVQNSCLELEEKRRRVKGTRMQNSSL